MLVSKRAFSTGPTLVLREVRVFVDFLQRLSLRDLFADPFQQHVVKFVGFVEELHRGRPAMRGTTISGWSALSFVISDLIFSMVTNGRRKPKRLTAATAAKSPYRHRYEYS
jgi:hypothetical protein